MEKYNEIEKVNGEYIIPDSIKSTLEGEAVVSGGVVVSQNGDEVDIEFEKINVPNFNFDKNYFSNASNKQGKFIADVTNPSGFVGTSISCSNMSVSVSYSDTAITEIEYSYATGKYFNTTVKYSFE